MIATLFIVGAYLAGSIPFGLVIARAKGVDIRQVGSGNIGATNVGRALGTAWGLLVFGLDFLKGLGPVLAARLAHTQLGDAPFAVHDLPVICAASAVLGHTFPIWLKFRGGKGGATGLGVGLVLCWQAMIAAAVVWLVTVAVSRYISLGTILGSVAYCAAYLVVAKLQGCPLDRAHVALSVFSLGVALLVIVRHRSNIVRLRAGTESRV
jgi:glycerol-3-phosphate acyltransferase PlsY